GRVLLTVDVAYTMDHWEERALPGFMVSAVDAVRSVRKFRALADKTEALVVTGHDPVACRGSGTRPPSTTEKVAVHGPRGTAVQGVNKVRPHLGDLAARGAKAFRKRIDFVGPEQARRTSRYAWLCSGEWRNRGCVLGLLLEAGSPWPRHSAGLHCLQLRLA